MPSRFWRRAIALARAFASGVRRCAPMSCWAKVAEAALALALAVLRLIDAWRR
jgi:hypothetical protein